MVWFCHLFVKVHIRAKTEEVHEVGAYRCISSFYCMKRLGVFLLFPAWDASPLQGLTPSINNCRSPFLNLGVDRHYKRKVSCPGMGSNLDCLNHTDNNSQLEYLVEIVKYSRSWFLWFASYFCQPQSVVLVHMCYVKCLFSGSASSC